VNTDFITLYETSFQTHVFRYFWSVNMQQRSSIWEEVTVRKDMVNSSYRYIVRTFHTR
jgi:hypothetical protein